MIKSKNGFTLIELLVVISIIGILAALTMTGFGAARKNARDAGRKSDINQYRTALEGYSANNNGSYPTVEGTTHPTTGHQANSIFGAAAGNPIVPEFLPTVINDPLPTSTTYFYSVDYYTENGAPAYSLRATMETGGTFETCANGKSCSFTTAVVADQCDCP